MTDIRMAGVDHTTAALAERERFALTTRRQGELLRAAAADEAVLGAVVLSTCNRTELWVHCRPGTEPPLAAWLCAAAGAADAGVLRARAGRDAAAHLFSLTCGLESRVFGEDQILTQVRESLDRAREAGCADAVLETLFRMAVTAAKAVKSGLQTSMGNTGAVGCALARLRTEGVPLAGRRCLVIGNGKMGKLAAQCLREAGADVTVTVRQYRSGVVEIPAGCRRVDYGQRMALLPESDLVLSATASPNVTVKYEELLTAGWRPGLLLIDLAVPRDIDPRTAQLDGVRLWDIDSLGVPETPAVTEARRRAETQLAARLEEFESWYACRDLLPRLEALARRFGTAAARRLPAGTTEAARASAALAAEKQLRHFLFALRDEAGAAALRQCVEAAERDTARE